MNDLKEEIKKSVLAAQETGNKFVEDPLWESQAWFLRTRLRFGKDYEQFYNHTQSQINDYVTNLNSEDQIRARAEVAESFSLAIKTGFDDCNNQMDNLLKKVFQVQQIEDEREDNNTSTREEPEIINLIDMEDESVDQRVQVDPPSKFDEHKKADPEPTSSQTVTSGIVAVLEEGVTEDEDFPGESLLKQKDAPAEHDGSVTAVAEEAHDEQVELSPRNDRLQVATPHRTADPEITNLVDEPLDESPEVIDLTHKHEEPPEVVEIVDVDDHEFDDVEEEIGESVEAPTPSHSRSLSLTEILLATFNEETQDSPERAKWYDTSAGVLATIVSRDTDDGIADEPTIETTPSKTMDIISTLGLPSLGTYNPAGPESAEPVSEGREGADDSERDTAEAERGGAQGSRMEPIDLTQQV